MSDQTATPESDTPATETPTPASAETAATETTTAETAEGTSSAPAEASAAPEAPSAEAEPAATSDVATPAEPARRPDPTKPPFLVITAILDSGARAAPVTVSHGDAYERARDASRDKALAGLDVVELPIPTHSFSVLRRHFQYPEATVAIYDLFPLSAHLDADERRVAGQFLAAEVLWTLDEQGLLPGVPLNVKLDVPQGWARDPKSVHEKLMQAGALEIGADGIQTYKEIKAGWEASAPKA